MKWLRFQSEIFSIALLIVVPSLLLFVTRSVNQSGDSLAYAFSASTGGGEMFHPHHLIFTPVIYLMHYVFSCAFADVDILVTGQLHNIAWAIATLLSVYFLVLYMTNARPLALWTAVLFFGTQGFLTFTTWFDVYVPALGCLAMLTAILVYARAGQLSRPRLAFLIGFLSLAILYHQTNFLIVFPLGLYFAMSPNRWFRDCITLVVSSGTIVLVLYVIVYVSRTSNGTFMGFVNFCRGYALHPNPTWGTWANISTQGFRSLVASQAWNIALLPSKLRVPVELLVALVIIFVLVWNTIWMVTNVELRAIRVFLILWICTYYVFFLWWLPGESQFFLVTMFPLLLLGTMTLCDICALLPFRLSKVLPTAVIASLSVLLLIRQLPVAWDNHVKRSETYERARILSSLVTDDTVIMTDYWTQQHVRFYFRHCRTMEIAIPALYFYRRLPLPPDCASAVNANCLVDARHITPNQPICGFNGYSHPFNWLAFLDWLLAFEYDSSGDVKSCKEFEFHGCGAGRTYIIMKHARQDVAGLKDVFRKLDQIIGMAADKSDQPFDKWLQQIGPTMKCTIQEMAHGRGISCPVIQ